MKTSSRQKSSDSGDRGRHRQQRDDSDEGASPGRQMRGDDISIDVREKMTKRFMSFVELYARPKGELWECSS